MKLSIDFETRSTVNLKRTGADKYARDPSAGVYCLAWAFDDEEPVIWLPGMPVPDRVAAHIEAGGTLLAWNASFERLIFNHVMPKHGWPIPKLEQYQCTAVRARAHGMPGALDICARAMGVPIGKAAEGARLIRQYSVNNTPWEEIPEADQQLWIEYCLQDVRVERGIGSCLRELDDFEWQEYHCSERINDRGIPVDVPMAAAAVEYAEEVRADVDRKILLATGGQVANARARKNRDIWLRQQLNDEALKTIASTKTKGALGFDADMREALLALDIPDAVRTFTELVEEAGGATIGKYTAVLEREVAGRIYGSMMFNGAGQTGRFSASGLQMHNLRRDGIEEHEQLIMDLIEGYEIDDVTTTLARLVRNVITHPGGLSWCDWSSIEGRVAPWLADSADGRKKLKLYVDGVDPYIVNAVATFHTTYDKVTPDQRQLGKVQELSLQFLGGVGALQGMARKYGVVLTEGEAEAARDGWRAANPWAQRYGRELEGAAMRAVMNHGQWFEAGRVAYACDGTWLWCKLPSGRLLAYYQPRIEDRTAPWGDTIPTITANAGGRIKAAKGAAGWPRHALWMGMLLENITQAVAADLLREALLACEDDGIPVVLHVHDEIVVLGDRQAQLQSVMLEQREWAVGLPLDAKPGGGIRYGK